VTALHKARWVEQRLGSADEQAGAHSRLTKKRNTGWAARLPFAMKRVRFIIIEKVTQLTLDDGLQYAVKLHRSSELAQTIYDCVTCRIAPPLAAAA
jgi:hypothetical protein